jgi:hypothetical protein
MRLPISRASVSDSESGAIATRRKDSFGAGCGVFADSATGALGRKMDDAEEQSVSRNVASMLPARQKTVVVANIFLGKENLSTVQNLIFPRFVKTHAISPLIHRTPLKIQKFVIVCYISSKKIIAFNIEQKSPQRRPLRTL